MTCSGSQIEVNKWAELYEKGVQFRGEMEKYFPDYSASQIGKMPANDGLLGKEGRMRKKERKKEMLGEINRCPLNGGDGNLGIS